MTDETRGWENGLTVALFFKIGISSIEKLKN
jgi:hypothetical protein